MNTRPLIAFAAAATVALVGCSANAPEPSESSAPVAESTTPSPSPTETSEASPTATTPPTSDRTYIVKEIGESGGLSNNEEQVMIFTLTEIQYGFQCEYAQPANGEFVGLRFNVEVLAGWPTDDPSFGPTFSMFYPDFQAFLADGTRINDPIGNGGCASPSDALPTDLGPAQSATGWIVLDLPTDAAAVALTPGQLGGSGWEWRLDG